MGPKENGHMADELSMQINSIARPQKNRFGGRVLLGCGDFC